MARTVGIMPLSMCDPSAARGIAAAATVTAAADAWRDTNIARLESLVDQLTGPPVCRGSAQLQRSKLLSAVRKEGTRRKGLLRARLQRAAASRAPTPPVELWAGKLIIGALRSMPSGLICSLKD